MTKSDSHTLYLALTLVLTLIPFLIVWFLIFKKFRNSFTTVLNYITLTLVSLIALNGYYILIALLGSADISIYTAFFGPTAYLICILLPIPIAIFLILTIVLTTKHFVKA